MRDTKAGYNGFQRQGMKGEKAGHDGYSGLVQRQIIRGGKAECKGWA